MGTCSGIRAQDTAINAGRRRFARVAAIAIHQLPTQTPVSTAAVAFGAHDARVASPAAHASSAAPEAYVQARGEPIAGGING